MSPTFYSGQKVIVKRFYNSKMWKKIAVNDIILMKDYASGKIFVKRVVATSESEIRLNGNQIFLPNYEGQLKNGTKAKLTNLAFIPCDYFFVAGDNSSDSYDSRDFGLVSKEQIIGKIIWPRGL